MEMRPGVRVSRTVVPDGIKDIPVHVVNLNKRSMNICVGTLVSDLEPVEVCSKQEENPVKAEYADTTLQGMADAVNESVSNEDRRPLLVMPSEFSSTLSRGNNDLSRTDEGTR